MSLRSRVKRLERERPNRGRCPQCRDRPGLVMKFFRQDSLDEPPIPDDTEGDKGEPCATCGWAPEVTEIIEVVVSSRDDVRRLAEIGAMGR